MGDDPVEKSPSTYTSGGRYTYLEAAARLLVRKDEVVAVTEFTSFCNLNNSYSESGSDFKLPVAVELVFVAQLEPQAIRDSDSDNLNVPVVGMFTFCCVLLLRRTITPRR